MQQPHPYCDLRRIELPDTVSNKSQGTVILGVSRSAVTSLNSMRIIRRYANRKLYDCQESHYVTLDALAGITRMGEDFQVVNHVTGLDLTASTLAQIIFEEEKRVPRISVAGLSGIIRTGQIP
jgi:polyhydroxyalkanoate synthesis repressor PhaR